MAAQARQTHRFYAHVRDEGRSHAHLIPGAATLQEAALSFAEHRAFTGSEVKVIAFDGDTGEERCFVIDLEAGEMEPCGG